MVLGRACLHPCWFTWRMVYLELSWWTAAGWQLLVMRQDLHSGLHEVQCNNPMRSYPQTELCLCGGV